MSLVILLAVHLGCTSEDSRTTSRTTRSDPVYIPLELLRQGAQLESKDSLVEALRAYDSCVAIAGRPEGDHSVLARCLLSRARLHLVLDLYARSVVDADSALHLQQKAGCTPSERGRAWLFLAGGLEGQQRFPQADSASDSALTMLSALQPPETSLHVDALCLRGRIRMQFDSAGEAERMFSTAVRLCPGEDRALRRWEAESLLGWSLVREGRLEEAEPPLLRAFAALSRKFGNEDPVVRAAASRVAELYERWQKHDLFAHYQAIATHSLNAEDAE